MNGSWRIAAPFGCALFIGLAAGDVAASPAPVAPYAKFTDGLICKTKPEGWLGKVCEKQRDGLTSHPEALSYPYDSCLWAGDITRDGTHGVEWWRYEQTAYYSDGLLRLGLVLGDDKLIGKGEAGVRYVLDHATAKGQLGHPCLWDEANHKLDAGHEMWPMAVFFRAMKACYEATGDERIPQALGKYYLNYDAVKIREERNIVSVEGMLWTYGLTRDERLLKLAEDAWNLDVPYMKNIGPKLCTNDVQIFAHGVTYVEEMKVPMLLAAYTGKPDYLRQAVNVEDKLERNHMLADGCPSSTEHTRGNSVHWGHETCVVSDFTWSLGYFLQTTGQARYADAIERCVFNAGLGAVDRDFKSLQYFSNLNQFRAAGDSDHNPLHPGTTWMQYRPTHETECCAGNVHRILPNYVSRMWLRDRTGAPVAALYGPSSVDYGWTTIHEETRYPFDGKIVFRFDVREPRRSAFTFRRPGWSRGMACRINGKVAELAEGDFVTLTRDFVDGDEIVLDIPMETVIEKQPRRRYVTMDYVTGNLIVLDGPAGRQGAVVRRGPIVYAYPIPTKRTEDTKTYSNLNGKKSGNPDFKCWTMEPTGSFSYALASGKTEFAQGKSDDILDAADPMATVRVSVSPIEWKWDGIKTPDLPDDVVPIQGEARTLELVPYASTCLRLTVFPLLEKTR